MSTGLEKVAGTKFVRLLMAMGKSHIAKNVIAPEKDRAATPIVPPNVRSITSMTVNDT